MEKSETITDIAKALVKAQSQITFAVKDAVNPFHKNKYADIASVIEAVKKPLNDNGISFLQAVNSSDTAPMLETMLLHETGQYLMTKTPIFCVKPNDPQALGTGITYSKRYALMAICGLPSEDDDGNAASGVGSAKKTLEPNEKQQAIIDAVCEKLLDSVPEGKVLLNDKVKSLIYATKGSYPEDTKAVGTIAAWIVSNKKMDSICAMKGN